MQLMDIAHLKNSKLMQLSNGERKRTQLAAALLEHPDVLVLDQPFVGLDVRSREKLADRIGELHQSGENDCFDLRSVAHPRAGRLGIGTEKWPG